MRDEYPPFRLDQGQHEPVDAGHRRPDRDTGPARHTGLSR